MSMGEIIMLILVLLGLSTYVVGSIMCQVADKKKWSKVGVGMLVGGFVLIMLAILVSIMIWGF